jgi:MYXO-CTERM domain-containing protein
MFSRLPAAASAAVVAGFLTATPVSFAQVGSYGSYAERTADTLLQFGTDRYGSVQQPILVSILNVNTLASPSDPLAFDEDWRVERRGRRNPGGANLATDQRTLEAFRRLSDLSGDARYSTFADTYTTTYTSNFTDAGRTDKGFVWWGWHRWVNVFDESRRSANGNHHELHAILPVEWDDLWRTAPAVAQQQADSAWQFHVVNKNTGEINRHDTPNRGHAFAMTTGEYVREFAHAYNETGDAKWLDRSLLLGRYHWDRRDMTTNLAVDDPANKGGNRFDGNRYLTSISGPHAFALLDAYDLVGDDASELLDIAVGYLSAYAQHGYDDATGKFWGSLRLDGTPVTEPRLNNNSYAENEPRGHLDLWQPYTLGYEHPLSTAQSFVQGYDLTGDADLLQAAERFADWIASELPANQTRQDTWYDGYSDKWAGQGAHAETYARTISFFAHLYAVTGDEDYLLLSQTVADEAIDKLWVDDTGIFRGHAGKAYYEAVDGIGLLMESLLDLDAVAVDRRALLAQRSVIVVPEPGSATGALLLGLFTLRRRRHDEVHDRSV